MAHADISFRKKSYEDGFAFTCMKAAYQHGITGRMDYSMETGVKIQAEGEQQRIEEFIKWIEINIKDTYNILFYNSLNYSGNFKEFDIYRHSA